MGDFGGQRVQSAVMPDSSRPQGSPLSSFHRTLRSFRFAGAGAVHVLRSQPNARVHVAVALLACGMAAWLRLPAHAWALLLLAIALVLSLEAINTAVEFAIDLASPAQHPLARAAKDAAAAAVLVSALLSVGVGACLFVPPILARLG